MPKNPNCMSKNTFLSPRFEPITRDTAVIREVKVAPNLTIEQASHKILRWCPDEHLEVLRDIGLSNQQILEIHPCFMGQDSTLAGHSALIGLKGRNLKLTNDSQTAFEIHDAAEAYLHLEGRLSDYRTGQKPEQARLEEQERTMYLLEQAGVSPKRASKIMATINKTSDSGKKLKQAEQETFVEAAKDFYTRHSYWQNCEPTPINLQYLKLYRFLYTDVFENKFNIKLNQKI